MEEILKKLEEIDAQIIKRVDELLKSGKSKEVIIGILNGEVEKMMVGLGLDKLADDYANKLLVSGLSTAKGLQALSNKESLIQAVGQNIEMLIKMQKDSLISNFTANANVFKTQLLEGLLSGVPTPQVASNIKAALTQVSDGSVHLLSSANVNTLIQDSFSNVSRTATAVAFEDDPEQRFEYTGGVIPTSSKQCEWLMNNQKAEGYTKEEIDAGIETPYGIINWNGRSPSYNCLHSFFPVDSQIEDKK